MLTNKKSLFLFLLSVILIFPISAHATIIVDMVTSVATVLRNVAGILTIACWTIAGIMFLVASGNPSIIGKARTMTYAAIAGTVLVLLATVATSMISSALFQGQ